MLTFHRYYGPPIPHGYRVPVDAIQLTNDAWEYIYSQTDHKTPVRGFIIEAIFITEEYLYPSTDEDAIAGVVSVPEELKAFRVTLDPNVEPTPAEKNFKEAVCSLDSWFAIQKLCETHGEYLLRYDDDKFRKIYVVK